VTRHLRLVPFVLLLACKLPPRSWAGAQGDACDETTPCGQHLTCVATRCVSPVGSMGLSDAAGIAHVGPDHPPPFFDASPFADLTSAPPDLSADQAVAPVDAGVPPRGEPSELPQQFIFLVTKDGHLMVNVNGLGSRLPGETFTRELTDLGGTIGGLARIDEIEAQGVGLEMNVMARAGRDASAASRRGTTWTRWTPVASGVRAMGLANHEGSLVACLVDEAGRLKLVTRGAGDVWGEPRDVTDEASFAAGQGERATTFTKVDCAGLGPDLEVVALDGNGRLWHATRKPAEWVRFHLLAGANGMTFRAVSASNALGGLHVVGATATTQLHAARSVTGEWTAFDDLERLGAIDPGGTVVAGSQASCFAEVWWTQVTSAGDLWLSFRLRDVLIPFWSEQSALSAGNPYVGAVMAFTLP
jgi:hypothetical protein